MNKEKPTNKLIEVIAEWVPDAVVELISRAYGDGDDQYLGQIIEALDDCDMIVLSRDEEKALREALAESVKLQAHYAELLNGWDGGSRMIFKTSQEWLDRLAVCKAAPLPKQENP